MNKRILNSSSIKNMNINYFNNIIDCLYIYAVSHHHKKPDVDM